MKKTAFQAIVLALVFMSPMAITTFYQVGNSDVEYEYFGNGTEEGQEGEQESETKEEKDLVEEFDLLEHHFTIEVNALTGYVSQSLRFTGISKDVLTPPPEST